MTYIDSFIPDPRWYDAPHERTPDFFRTYAQVSIALQEALRQLAPATFLADVSHFEKQQASYVMLAYAASRPFRPKSRTDFCYDVTNASAMRTFYRFSRRKLNASLVEAQARLLACGQDELAPLYDPREIRYILPALKRKRLRRPLHRLLLAEGKLLNELTAFGGLDECSPKKRRKQAALIWKRWRSILQHACLAIDLSCLARPLFEAATRAYLNAREQAALSEPDSVDHLLDLAA